MFVEVRLFTDRGTVAGMRCKDAQEAVTIDVQVGHEHQGRILGCLLRRDPSVGDAGDGGPGRVRMAAEIMVADGDAVSIVIAPILALLKRLREVGAIEHSQRTGVLEEIALGSGGQDRRVSVVGVVVVGPAAREGILKIARVNVRDYDELANVVQA